MTTDSKRALRRPLAGFRIGILVLDTVHELVPGNLQHAGSFDFPVLYEVVRGVTGNALMRGDRDAGKSIVASARKLENAGVGFIVGACGSFANYQQVVAAAVNVPVFMSILLEVPMLLRALPKSRKLGIIFASTDTFTEKVRTQCAIIQTERIVVVGADAIEAFRPILAQQGRLDSGALGRGLARLARNALRQHPDLGAWLLQCSDLPPYAAAIQQTTSLPVFHMGSLIGHLHDAFNGRSIECHPRTGAYP
jgi:hypothetical protein